MKAPINTLEKPELIQLITANSTELHTERDLDALVEQIGDARFALLGEASHGTHEYYMWRAAITKKLIVEKGFSFIAVEGDWPDCYRLNRYIKNYPDAGKNAFTVLHSFNRWPTWMWANWEIVALAEWLKKHNQNLSRSQKVGFYGLDVYSLSESFDTIINYLDKVDRTAKKTAIEAYRCFERYGVEEGRAYAHATAGLVPSLCENEVVELLAEIRKKVAGYNTDYEAALNAEQNAHVIVNAERYYRTMIKPGPGSWNIRDHHMMDTLNRLMEFHGKDAKVIVWEHNTHIGDARATDMVTKGMINIGQLVNEQHAKDGVFSVGFGSYQGTVMAGRNWGDIMRIIHMPPAAYGSWEYMLHELGEKNRIVFMNKELKQNLGQQTFGHRAIGVVYQPQYEQYGNYVSSVMPARYNAFIFLDKTRALHPLHLQPDGHQIPETYPFGI